MSKTSSFRTTLAVSLFLLSTFNPCAGTTHKSPQDIDGEKLLQAIQENDTTTATNLLQQQRTPNLEIKDAKHGGTPLHWAAGKDFRTIVKLLLDKGAHKNAFDNRQETPLYVATEQGHAAMVKLLLENGANQDSLAKENWTPLHIAVIKEYTNIVALLLQYKANQTIPNIQRQTPLDIAYQLPHSKNQQAILALFQADTWAHQNQTPSPQRIQTGTHNNLNQNTNASSRSTQGNTTNAPQDQKKASLLTKENTIKATILFILLSGIRYILWPKSDTPHATKSNQRKRKQKRTKATRTADAK